MSKFHLIVEREVDKVNPLVPKPFKISTSFSDVVGRGNNKERVVLHTQMIGIMAERKIITGNSIARLFHLPFSVNQHFSYSTHNSLLGEDMRVGGTGD